VSFFKLGQETRKQLEDNTMQNAAGGGNGSGHVRHHTGITLHDDNKNSGKKQTQRTQSQQNSTAFQKHTQLSPVGQAQEDADSDFEEF